MTGLRKCGFSLAELLISFLILTLMMVTLLTIIPIVLGGINKASQRAQASYLARQTLEQMRVRGAQGLTITGQTPVMMTPQTLEGAVFQVQYQVNDVPLLPRDPYVLDPTRNYLAYQVDVYIYWGDAGAKKMYRVSTQIGRNP